jgi:serine/threonine protein phosphatase 1
MSDLHGCHEQFNEMLLKTKYNPTDDKLILLGDYIDRGIKSKDVVEQIKNLHEEFGIIVLRGNHDQMMIDAFDKDEDALWINNGGLQTIASYAGNSFFEEGFEWDEYIKAKDFIKKHYSHHIDFLKSLPLFHEDEEFIFVHAGLHPMYEDWKQQPAENYIWIREIFLNNPTTVNKTVIFGHTPTLNLHQKATIWYDGDKIGIDGACAYGYQLNCLEIAEDSLNEYNIYRNKTR